MYLKSLRAALGSRIGQELTPELCAEIENAARILPDEAIPLDWFAPKVVGDDYVLSAERFEAIWSEMEPMNRLHWQETEKYRHGVVFRPNYPGLVAFERQGQLLQLTVRHRAQLMGNLRVFITSSWHTQEMVASEDSLFIMPAARLQEPWLALKLVRYAVECVEIIRDRRGADVVEITANSKAVNHADVIMRRVFGAGPVAYQFSKLFHRRPNHVLERT